MENNNLFKLIQASYGVHTEEEPKTSKKPEDASTSKKERMLKKLNAMFSKSGIEISEDERKLIEEFSLRTEVLEASVDFIHLLPEGHPFLRVGNDSMEKVVTDDKFMAVIKPDRQGRVIMNLCFKPLSVKLRAKAYATDLERALKDWIILRNKLQVKGWKVNPSMTPEKEIESDKNYLEQVIAKMKKDPFFNQVVTAISSHPEFTAIYTTAVVWRAENEKPQYLFNTDAVLHSKKMAQCGEAYDLLQGELKTFAAYGESFADLDPSKPSLYLHRGNKGLRPNLFVPEAMMREFSHIVGEPGHETAASDSE